MVREQFLGECRVQQLEPPTPDQVDVPRVVVDYAAGQLGIDDPLLGSPHLKGPLPGAWTRPRNPHQSPIRPSQPSPSAVTAGQTWSAAGP